jgi:predicted esterase
MSLLFALFALTQEPRTGSFSTTFAERSPLSSMKEFTTRCKASIEQIKKLDPAAGEYDLAKESFQICVPKAYKPGVPHGLLVYISAGNDGSPSADWIPLLEKFSIVWVGANQSGNERLIWYRTNLALDAVYNMKKLYAIDLDRVYVSGESGGGRSSSRTALEYPDVFSGGIFMIGCDYFRTVKNVEPGKSTVFQAMFPAPAGSLLDRAKTKNRYVILTGEKDMNRYPCLSMAAAFKEDKFAHVTLFDVPGMGHERPVGANVEWFEKALAALDAPIAEKSKKKP